MASYSARLRNASKKPESLSQALKHLDVPAMRRLAADRGDREEADAAQRRLEHLLVMTAFYEPPDRFERHDPAGALGMIDIARKIRPDAPYLCYDQARALTALNRIDEAMAALVCWLRTGNMTAAELQADPNLAPLRGQPEFIRLRDGIGAEKGIIQTKQSFSV